MIASVEFFAGLSPFEAYFCTMALNGSTRRSPDPWHGNRPTHDSFDIWVNKNGKDAFKDFKKDHPTTKHSYDSWRQTEQVYGPYLFYITSIIWHEDGDSVR